MIPKLTLSEIHKESRKELDSLLEKHEKTLPLYRNYTDYQEKSELIKTLSYKIISAQQLESIVTVDTLIQKKFANSSLVQSSFGTLGTFLTGWVPMPTSNLQRTIDDIDAAVSEFYPVHISNALTTEINRINRNCPKQGTAWKPNMENKVNQDLYKHADIAADTVVLESSKVGLRFFNLSVALGTMATIVYISQGSSQNR